MYLSEYDEGQRLLRIMSRARSDVPAKIFAPAPRRINEAGEELAEEERRRAPRIATKSEMLLRRVGSIAYSVPLGNLSVGGCCVEIVEGLTDGDDLVARLPKLEPLGARVRWAEGKQAGFEFSRPIHPAVFQALLERMNFDAAT